MKKTIVVISASVLGLGGAAIAGTAPASALPIPTCTDVGQQYASTFSDNGDWFASCIPKYGMGKAEFTIKTTGTETFPAGYSLTDGKQTVTSSSPTTAQTEAYFGEQADAIFTPNVPTFTGSFMDLYESASTSTSQTYSSNPEFYHEGPGAAIPMDAAFPILSATTATTGFPTACTTDSSDPTATYDGEYVVTYGPTTTTFSETIDGVVHSVTAAYTPPPLYIGLNFTQVDENSANGVDTTAPICVSSGGQTAFADNITDDGNSWQAAYFTAAGFPPALTELSYWTFPTDEADTSANLIDFGIFDVTADPVLATTGVDPTPAALLGGSLFGLGILMSAFALVRRRRSRYGRL